MLKIEKAIIVYQAGIANLFSVERFESDPTRRGKTQRLFQGTFKSAECIAHGMDLAGTQIKVCSCNQAGGIIDAKWSRNLIDCPFRDEAHPNTAWLTAA